MDKLIQLFFILLYIYESNGQTTTLPFRVMEGVADFPIVTLSESEEMAQMFEADELENFVYNFISYPEDDQSLLSLDESNGRLTTGRALDREEYCAYQEFCYLRAEIAIIEANRGPVSSVIIQILLEDENDNSPVFQNGEIGLAISEAAPVGSSRSLQQATDMDSPQYGVNNNAYELVASNGEDVFEVEYADDELFLVINANLDRETTDSYSLNLVAYDKGVPPLSSTMEITITVNDYNDHEPVFTSPEYNLEVSEAYSVGEELLQVHASDEDIGPNGQVRYSFSEFTRLTYGDMFDLDAISGSIILLSELNYEQSETYVLEIIAQDQNPNPQVSTATVEIQVLDVNDNSPRVQINTLTDGREAEVLENEPAGTLVAHVSVVDDDSGQNGNIACTLANRAFNLQAIPSSTQYKLITSEALDSEVQSRYNLSINCMDFGDPQLFQETFITVNVIDKNDNVPRFSEEFYSVSIQENNHIGDFLVQVQANDMDSGDNGRITYSIVQSTVPNYIDIDSRSGILRCATIINYESPLLQNHQIMLEVKAQDHGDPPNFASTFVVVNITDVNDEAPTFTESRYSFHIDEHAAAGSSVGQITASDADSYAFNRFQLSLEQDNPDTDVFMLDENGVIYVMEDLDREEKDLYRFHVYAIDERDSFLRGSTEILINIDDINDYRPLISYPTGRNRTIEISNKVPVGYEIIQIRAFDNDIGNNADLIFELHFPTGDPNNREFNIDRDLGRISTRKDFSSEVYLETGLEVIVRDRGNPSLSSTVELLIIIDKAIPYNTGRSSGGSSQRENKPDAKNVDIIVGLSVTTAIIVIGLVVAIVILRKKDRKNPQDAYIHTTIEPKTIPINTGNVPHAGFIDENNPAVGSDDTLNSNQSNDSGKGSSETDLAEHKQPGQPPVQQPVPAAIMRTQRPTYNRSKSADRLSLSVPPTQQNNGTYLRPVPSRRSRTVSESSALRYGMIPGSPQDYPDSMPLWHGSYERMPQSPGAESVQLGRGYAHFTSAPTTPTVSSSLNNQFRFPNLQSQLYEHKDNAIPGQPHSGMAPQGFQNRQFQQFSRSAQSSPAVGSEPFQFPLSLPPMDNRGQFSLPSDDRGREGEDVYETYGSDIHNHSHTYMPPSDMRAHESISPVQYESLNSEFQNSGGRQLSSPYHHQQSQHMHEPYDLNGHMTQAPHQYFDQSGQINNYSPNHYTQIHYPENSINPTDLVV